MRHSLSGKTDVYSFGIVALEIVVGRSVINPYYYKPSQEKVYLLEMVSSYELIFIYDVVASYLNWLYQACALQESGDLLDIVDPELGSEYSSDEAILLLNLGLMCAANDPNVRPKMSQVVSVLEGRNTLQDLRSNLSENQSLQQLTDPAPSDISFSKNQSFMEIEEIQEEDSFLRNEKVKRFKERNERIEKEIMKRKHS